MGRKRKGEDPVTENIRFLQDQIRFLQRQIEEKDRQIAMVLEHQFDRPVMSRTEPVPAPQVSIDAETIAETPRFDPEKDKEQIAAEEKRFEDSAKKLDDELEAAFKEVAQEHAEAHAESPA